MVQQGWNAYGEINIFLKKWIKVVGFVAVIAEKDWLLLLNFPATCWQFKVTICGFY
jgi:hypothetical protein